LKRCEPAGAGIAGERFVSTTSSAGDDAARQAVRQRNRLFARNLIVRVEPPTVPCDVAFAMRGDAPWRIGAEFSDVMLDSMQ